MGGEAAYGHAFGVGLPVIFVFRYPFEHFAMHYGQIVYITKLIRGEDLGLYRELNKTGRLPQKQN